jgi:hypothetical protein
VTVTYESPNGDDDTGFDCRLDGGEWFACDGGTTTVPETDLPPGEHTFEVRACDREREVCDPTPATVTWTVVESPCPEDTTAPVLSCTETVTLECVGGTATVDVESFKPTATDACEPVTVTAAEPEAYVPGDNPVVFTGTHGNGNTASCATAVRITDTVAPVLTCVPAITVANDPTFCGAVVSLQAPAANDACTGAVATFTNDAPESFGLGATVVTWTGTDASGNAATCTTTVTVTRGPNADVVCTDPDDGLVAQGGAGCASGEGLSWFLLLGFAALVGLRRRRLA